MGYYFLAVNTVGRLGLGFGSAMVAGIVLMVAVFVFISLKDNPAVLMAILVIIGVLCWIFFGDMFFEAVRTLMNEV